MTSQFPIRPLVAAALSVLGMGGLSTVHAAYNGQVLTSTQVPGDVLINRDCMATLIAPRVALTSAMCLSDSQTRTPQVAPAGWPANRPYVKFYRARDGRAFNGTYVKFTDKSVASVGDLAVVAFDQDVEPDAAEATKIIPDYAAESLGVSDPAARKGKSGAGFVSTGFLNSRLQLVAYARDSFNADAKADGKDAKTGAVVSTFNPAGILAIRKVSRNLVKAACSSSKACGETTALEYQSIMASKAEFGDLLNPDVETPAIGRKNQLRRLYTEFGMADADIDDMLIATPYRQQGNSAPPFVPGDQGAGLFGVGPDGREYLVGIGSDNTTQVRLLHYWPWVYRTVMQLWSAYEADADAIANKVMNAIDGRKIFDPRADWYKNNPQGAEFRLFNYYFRETDSDARVVRTLRGTGAYPNLVYKKTYGFFRPLTSFNGPANNQISYAPPVAEDGLPDKEVGKYDIRSWNRDSRAGKVGEYYAALDFYKNDVVRYYRLKKLLGNGSLAYLPEQSNDYWEYLGESLPRRALKYQYSLFSSGSEEGLSRK